MNGPAALRAQKAALRKTARSIRDQAQRRASGLTNRVSQTAHAPQAIGGIEAGEGLARNIAAAVTIPETSILSGYWPIGSEMDVMASLLAHAGRGGTVVLPVVVESGAPLVFRRWRVGDPMDKGPFGIEEPQHSAESLVPDVLLVPLLAFDRAGYRLGYGGGFYDRTLRQIRALKPVTAIGVAFAAQETPETPRDSSDERLDWIITERGAIGVTNEINRLKAGV